MKVKITIANPKDFSRRREVPDAIVDTGASWTSIPKALADERGLDVIGTRRVTTANGVIEVEHSFALVEYDGHQSVSDVMITDKYPGVLLSALTLEGMAVAVDPKGKRLIDTELLLL